MAKTRDRSDSQEYTSLPSPRTIRTTEEMVRHYVTASGVKMKAFTDGDVFQLTREFMIHAFDNENVIFDNPVEMFFWLLKIKDELKKSA